MDKSRVEIATENALKVNFDNIPEELKEKNQFVNWMYEEEEGEEDLKKPPFSPKTGRRASVRNPATWGSLDEARTGYETGKYAGIGIVLRKESGIVGVDVDHCVISGKLTRLGEWFLIALPTYAEYSPSGTGLRFFLLECFIPGPFRRTKTGVEIYEDMRYLTVTGHQLEGTPRTLLTDQARLELVYRKVFEKEYKRLQQETRGVSRQIRPRINIASDEAILQKALNAKNGRDFSRYYYGDNSLWEGSGGLFDSQSEADLALVYRLLYWTNGDVVQTERLFRLSGLMRPKWDRVIKDSKTYGEVTIDKALPAYLAHAARLRK